MRKVFLGVLVVICLCSFAVKQDTKQTVKLELTIEEVNLVIGVLSKQPYEVSSNIISKIVTQSREQLAEQPQPKKKG